MQLNANYDRSLDADIRAAHDLYLACHRGVLHTGEVDEEADHELNDLATSVLGEDAADDCWSHRANAREGYRNMFLAILKKWDVVVD